MIVVLRDGAASPTVGTVPPNAPHPGVDEHLRATVITSRRGFPFPRRPRITGPAAVRFTTRNAE